jgi:hypothetical protein
MTSLNKLIKETTAAKNSYEGSLADKDFLPARIQELQLEIIQIEKDLSEAEGALTKPLWSYSSRYSYGRKSYGSKAAQKVYDLQRRLDSRREWLASAEERLANIDNTVAEAKSNYEMALYLENAERQRLEIKASRPKKERKPVEEVDRCRSIPATFTGKMLEETLKGWRKSTGLVSVSGVQVQLGVLGEFASGIGSGMMKVKLGEVKGTFYSEHDHAVRSRNYDGPALIIEYELTRTGNLVHYSGISRIINMPGKAEYYLEIGG